MFNRFLGSHGQGKALRNGAFVSGTFYHYRKSGFDLLFPNLGSNSYINYRLYSIPMYDGSLLSYFYKKYYLIINKKISAFQY